MGMPKQLTAEQKQKLSTEERDILDTMARLEGQEFVDQNWQLILNQARALGEID
jgi:hypothetical protein